jgi:hypothetical protein
MIGAVGGSIGMSNFTSWYDQVLGNPLPNNGSIHIVVEWRVHEEILGFQVSKAIENQHIFMESHMTMLELKKILAFRSKHTKLDLSLIMIVSI